MKNVLTIVVLLTLTSRCLARIGLITLLERGFIDLVVNCDDVKDVRHHINIDPTKVYLHWYETRTNKSKYFNMQRAVTVFGQHYDSKHGDPVYLYSHGFKIKLTDPASIRFTNGMLKLTNINYLVLDATKYFSFDDLTLWDAYTKAVSNVYGIGYLLGNLLAEFIKEGLPLDKLHVFGHSLGAHAIGYAAQRVYNVSGKKLRRISGMDPAMPCFDDMNISDQITSENAEYVDIYHNNRGVFGTMRALGTANFFINNGGPLQPSCPGLPLVGQTCSHLHYSLNFWVASALEPQQFVAQQCDSYGKFVMGYCEDRPKARAGFFSEPCKGDYYIAYRFNYFEQVMKALHDD